MRMNSNILVGYVTAVAVTALVALATIPMDAFARQPVMVLLLIGLTAVVGAYPVRFSSLRTEMTATQPFVFFALVTLGAMSAVLVALAGVVGALIARRRPLVRMHLAFNLCSVTISTVAAHWVFNAMGGLSDAGYWSLLFPLAYGAAAYYLINTSLVTVAISIEKQRHFIDTWTESFRWTAAAYFSSLSLAVGLLFLLERVGTLSLALSLPPCWLLLAFYRTHRERMDEKQRRLEDVEALNARLDATVAELQESLDHVKLLQGLLPICMHCKSIKDEKDSWQKLEKYLAEHSEATFTHSLCGECRHEHYPELSPVETVSK
jgi:hypothetical protein